MRLCGCLGLSWNGSDKRGDASDLHFPGFGEAAARLLVDERHVSAIGIDTASIDYGPSTDFIVHQIVGARNVLAYENLTQLDKVSPTPDYLATENPWRIWRTAAGYRSVTKDTLALVKQPHGTVTFQ